MIDSVTSPVPRPARVWRTAVIAAVAVLAIGIGAVTGAFLMSARAVGAGPAAGYVPADAPMYVELRLLPSDRQDAALRGILERFPIPGLRAGQPLVEQLIERLDEALADADVDISYADDIAPWWDGRLALAYTDLTAMMADPYADAAPGVLVLVGVTDGAAAEAAIDRVVEAARQEEGAVEIRSQEHGDTTVWTVEGSLGVEAAYAVTDDQLLIAPRAEDVTDAIDRRAAGQDSLARTDALSRLSAGLPEDWLMLGIVNGRALFDQLRSAAAAVDPDMGAFYDALLEGSAVDVVTTVAATEDRFLFDVVSDQPAGDLAMANADRGLADSAPADALLYVEGSGIGPAYARTVRAIREAIAADPWATEDLDLAETALGTDLEDLLSWIEEGALVAGWDGDQPYGGLILVASDADAARERVGGLLALARLAPLDPSTGISVDEQTIADTRVTTIRWDAAQAPAGMGFPWIEGDQSVALQVAIGEERVLIGLGDRFVPRVLELDEADSLAATPRFGAVMRELGGTSNAGAFWIDLAGTRTAVEGALADSGLLELGDYQAAIGPWLVPFDRFVGVSRVEGDIVVHRSALLFD